MTMLLDSRERENAMLKCCFLVIGLLGVAAAAQAQPRTPDIHNRIGNISDEVAVQRLRLAGVENPRILRREGQQIIVQGNVQGRETTLRVDALRGFVTEAANPAAVVVAPGVAAANPVVTGRQLLQPRETLADPLLMREAVRPGP
jgi:hypothetical protein